jgi:hypothetical protein
MFRRADAAARWNSVSSKPLVAAELTDISAWRHLPVKRYKAYDIVAGQ